MEFYSLEESHLSDKPVRVQWSTDEYPDRHSEHNYNYQTRILKGIAEDGSEWSMAIDVNIHDDDDWYELDSAYMENKPGTTKYMSEPIAIGLDEIYWSSEGYRNRNRNRRYRKVETQKYFNNLLGEYPNIDHTKTKYHKDNEEEPNNRIFKRIDTIPLNKVADRPGKGVEFLRVPNNIDNSLELGDSIIKLTDTGIFKNNIEISLGNMNKQQRDILNLASRELFNGDIPRNT